MTDLLIVSHQDDIHATALAYASERCGQKAKILSPKDVCNWDKYAWSSELKPPQHEGKDLEPKTIWMRKLWPAEPPIQAHPDDRSFAAKSATTFFRNMFEPDMMETQWYNSPWAGRRAENKLLQLKLARSTGMSIPETLVSNDPDEVRKFFVRHERSGVIVKPIRVESWHEDEGIFGTYTSEIDAEDLEDDLAVRMAPMIYQTKVEKSFELRVTVINKSIISARVNSQEQESSKLDSRADPGYSMQVAPFQLPEADARKILRFMSLLSIRFGVFDFAVTPDDELVFFEVNEMGQFLWVELMCPQIPLLKITARELLGSNEEISFKEFRDANYHQDYLASLKHQYEPGFPNEH